MIKIQMELNCVPYGFMCPKYLVCLHAHVLSCLGYLFAHVPMCFGCLRAHVSTCFACLLAHVLTCLAYLCSRGNVPYVLMCSCVFVGSRIHVPTCSSSLDAHVQACLACVSQTNVATRFVCSRTEGICSFLSGTVLLSCLVLGWKKPID